MKRPPGIYTGLTYEEYDAIDAVRAGHLGAALRSPAHYQAALRTTKSATAAMKRGKLVHSLLDPGSVAREYTTYYGDKVKDPKRWKQFKLDNADKEIVSADELSNAQLIAESCHRAGEARDILRKPGQSEVVLVWTDEVTGLLCKCRIDWLTDDEIVDFKTADDAEPEQFIRRRLVGYVKRDGVWQQRDSYGYCRQLAHYRRGAEAHGLNRGASIIAVETSDPYPVVVIDLQPSMLVHGNAQVSAALAIIADANKHASFPAYPGRVKAELPEWVEDFESLLLGVEHAA
jgi:hypothetical protein